MSKKKRRNPHVCCTCARPLDPHVDAVVYLGWERRLDGLPGPGRVAALCAPGPHVAGESPCVVAAREWAAQQGVTFVPSDYAAWLGT